MPTWSPDDREMALASTREGGRSIRAVPVADLKQRKVVTSETARLVEFAHRVGVPVATHEIFQAAFVGVDHTEQTAASSRRGYSPKMATRQRSYEDVVQLFDQSQRICCPMISGGGTRQLFELDGALMADPRCLLYPGWIQRQVAEQLATMNAGGGGDPRGGSGRMVVDIMRAGGLVVPGTDTPNAIKLHGELLTCTMAGMSNVDGLKTATVNPAHALPVNGGTIEPGTLADLIVLDGNPLECLATTTRLTGVVANGMYHVVADLVKGRCRGRTPPGLAGRPLKRAERHAVVPPVFLTGA